MPAKDGKKKSRFAVKAMDDLLGRKFSVLNDGFVRVVDYMGGDSAVVQAARISYGEGTKKVRDDRGLIRYLMRHRHTSPFEMCEIKIHIRVPMDCWRQWIRHRTANVNEYSTRYSLAIDSAQKTPQDRWRKQAKSNRQGSGYHLPKSIGAGLSSDEQELHGFCRDVYDQRLAAGVAREQARKDLPLSTYTEAYWKIDLHNLLHFLALRLDTHAQTEIRAYGNVIGYQIVAKWCPIVWQAFLDYRLNAEIFSKAELAILSYMIGGKKSNVLKLADTLGWLERSGRGLKANRERTEFETKLERMHIVAPWDNGQTQSS